MVILGEMFKYSWKKCKKKGATASTATATVEIKAVLRQKQSPLVSTPLRLVISSSVLSD